MRQFTADASHELRAPLTLIYTAAQFALRRERSPDELKESLHKIMRAAQRCTELINQLLWLARSDAGNSGLKFVSTDLRAMAKEVVSEVSTLASDKGLTVAADMPEEPVRAAVDEDSFRRMLLILLDNAIKYTSEGGSITLRVRQTRPKWRSKSRIPAREFPPKICPSSSIVFGVPTECVLETRAAPG